MSLKEQVTESAEWCVGVKVHPAELEAFANSRPQCRSHSRLSKGEQTFNIFGVNTHTHLLSSRGSGQLHGVSGTDRQHVQDGVVRFPLPCQAFRHFSASGPAVVPVAPNLTLEQCRDALRPRRAFSQQPPPGSLPSHATFGAYPLRAFRTGQV